MDVKTDPMREIEIMKIIIQMQSEIILTYKKIDRIEDSLKKIELLLTKTETKEVIN